jgi:CBS domain-containing protein
MKAKDIMVPEVPTISKKASVKEALMVLRDNFRDESYLNSAPGLVVVNEGGELAGILTPLTIITVLLENMGKVTHAPDNTIRFYDHLCRHIRDQLVEDIMERQPISVTEDAVVLDVANLFIKHRFHRIPVVRDKKVVGIIYRTPLLFSLTKCLFK